MKHKINESDHHYIIEEIATLLAKTSGNSNASFFRVIVVYFLAQIASSMRTNIKTDIMGIIPVNLFAIALAPSGFGKGSSIKIFEKNFLTGFKQRYLRETFPAVSKKSIYDLAVQTSVLKQTDEQKEYDELIKDFNKLGQFVLTFDSGTVPAIKQLRDKLLMAGTGSLNLQIDEIGSNLSRELELLNCFLELFDGEVKKKLVKNTVDNKRTEDLEGLTPANLLLFGTPNKLFDGSSNEKDLFSLLETGFARRCFFALGIKEKTDKPPTATEMYLALADPGNVALTTKYRQHFTHLADPLKHGLDINLNQSEGILLLEYKEYCEKRSELISEFEEIKKTEMSHRHFKALKLAGILSFIEEEQDISRSTLLSAFKLVEESGEALYDILNKDPGYVKLARFIASTNELVTHADLHQALPFYKETNVKRRELMSLAIAWGYKNFIIIKSEIIDGIEFFSGESLQETDLEELLISISQHPASGYEAQCMAFEDLISLGTISDFNWCNHTFKDNHRCDLNIIKGFNTIVLDVDDPKTSIKNIEKLMEDTKYVLYTTKRHTEENPRFRIIIPIKYILYLDKTDYRLFINNIINWLPFPVDPGSADISRKWLTHESDYVSINTKGDIFDPIAFIPKTSKNQQLNEEMLKLKDISSIEKWFITQINMKGQRNNYLLKYALLLKDNKFTFQEIENSILSLNSNLADPLSESEIKHTILKSVANKLLER